MLDPRFLPHNSHLVDAAAFGERDPNLVLLKGRPLVYRYPLLGRLPSDQPGIYSITGGRQVGKTTVLKQWMADLLRHGVKPERIAYLTGELIDDHHSLVRMVGDLVKGFPVGKPSYVMMDEVTYIKEWARGVKYLADAGLLRSIVLMLTGSDSVLIQDARAQFPGRRGRAALTDFRLHPLTFAEYVGLKDVPQAEGKDGDESLARAFDRYLLHGGYLTAINDVEERGTVLPSTFAIYCDWIRGDVLKRGKQERFLREILGAVVRRYGTHITWNALSADLSIDHPATVADYIELLERMGVLFVQFAVREDTLSAAPKKARKVMTTDPFILHAIRSWLEPVGDPFRDQALPLVADPEWMGRLVEACVVSHFSRFHPTYYIKADGEVDVAYVEKGRLHPIEVKWTAQVRSKDLKQLLRYPNARVFSRLAGTPTVQGVRNEFVPRALLRLGASPTT